MVREVFERHHTVVTLTVSTTRRPVFLPAQSV
jgi:hypothetical protein